MTTTGHTFKMPPKHYHLGVMIMTDWPSGYFNSNAERFGVAMSRLREIESPLASDKKNSSRIVMCHNMLRSILANQQLFDDNCPHSISTLGGELKELIDVILTDKLTEPDLTNIVAIFGRFALEHFARTSINIDGSEALRNWLIPSNGELSINEMREAVNGPFLVWRQIHANDITEFMNKRDSINEFVASLNADVKKQQEIISTTQGIVERAIKDAHFIGLYKAFNELTVRKRLSIGSLRRTTWALALLCIVTSALPAYVVAAYWPAEVKDVNELFKLIGERSLATLTTIVPLLLLLVYWLRVKYLEYKSESGVLLQLEVRASVCQFIQGYSDWCKDQDPTKVQLDKFAAMIFSNVTPDPAAVPGAFDGMDQFANLIKAVKEPAKP